MILFIAIFRNEDIRVLSTLMKTAIIQWLGDTVVAEIHLNNNYYLKDILFLAISSDNMTLFDMLFYVDEINRKIGFNYDVVDVDTIDSDSLELLENIPELVRIAIKNNSISFLKKVFCIYSFTEDDMFNVFYETLNGCREKKPITEKLAKVYIFIVQNSQKDIIDMSLVSLHCNMFMLKITLEKFPITSENEAYEMLYGIIINNILKDTDIFRTYLSFIHSKENRDKLYKQCCSYNRYEYLLILIERFGPPPDIICECVNRGSIEIFLYLIKSGMKYSKEILFKEFENTNYMDYVCPDIKEKRDKLHEIITELP